MHIPNIRFGFATNSSSTHSIIVIKPDENIRDKIEEDYFGWEEFVLRSPSLKLDYLNSLINLSLKSDYNFSESFTQSIINSLYNSNITNILDIDHNSSISIPKEYGYNNPSIELIKDLMKFVLREDIVILGGNDNIEFEKFTDRKRFKFPLNFSNLKIDNNYIHYYKHLKYNPSIYARYETKYDYWTLFSSYPIPVKFQLDLKHYPDLNKIYLPDTPELVDLKITDYCDKECNFCYQGSSKKGKHAEENTIYNILWVLKELKVFEVALGGGEPTTHPHFKKILKNVVNYGMVPNFTTSRLDWMYEDPEIFDYVGGIGYTCTSNLDTKILDKILKDFNYFNTKLTIQIPMGCVTRNEFEYIVKYAKDRYLNILLLGFKKDGRAHKFNPIDYHWWCDIIEKNKIYYFGVDTSMLYEYLPILELKSDSVFFSSPEGSRSMYIDAIEQFIAPASYNIKNKYYMNEIKCPMKMVDFYIEKFNEFQNDALIKYKETLFLPLLGNNYEFVL
ncbi:MAG: hypothetical protein KatS3mg002_0430 [Candidatus Woesearchaeota archaeon]|nr:MAG: hypothetical protein KatS3mg002_0430 [Candidatus Woesearchaeota archaeon]